MSGLYILERVMRHLQAESYRMSRAEFLAVTRAVSDCYNLIWHPVDFQVMKALVEIGESSIPEWEMETEVRG